MLLIGCSVCNMKNNGVIIEEIPLEKFSKEGGYHVNIHLKVDGHKTKVLLDTGAPTSRVQSDEVLSKYPVVDKSESKGVSGKGVEFSVIAPKMIALGNSEIASPKITISEGLGVLGLDILENFIFQYDLKNSVLRIVEKLNPVTFPLKRLKRGHITIPLVAGKELNYGLVDTGADISLVDKRYIDAHPELFTLLRKEDGTDHNGNKVESFIYACKELKVGNLTLKDVEMATFEFPDFLRSRLEGTDFLLGNNVIGNGKWTFDLKKNFWSHTN